MRDTGKHSFAFELAAYGTDFAHSAVVAEAEQFARPPLPVREPIAETELPSIRAGSACITHVKPAEDGNGIILRITEHGGRDGNATLSVPGWAMAVYRTDLPEKGEERLPLSQEIGIPLRPFEIATVRLCKKEKKEPTL